MTYVDLTSHQRIASYPMTMVPPLLSRYLGCNIIFLIGGTVCFVQTLTEPDYGSDASLRTSTTKV
jgi:hypothetical protein